LIFLLCGVLFSFDCSPSLAIEAYRPANVFVSRERAGDPLAIRQETYKIGQALISRPHRTDTIVSDMLRAHGITSLEEYLKWLRDTIRYKRDGGDDIWALPEETLERRYGDCEDYAFLNAAVLQVLGYRPKVLALMGIRMFVRRCIANHAICAFEKDGHYLYFDNGELKSTDASSMDEFARYIFAHYRCLTVSELSFDYKNKGEKVLFTTPPAPGPGACDARPRAKAAGRAEPASVDAPSGATLP
jgi:hypothetical protein